MEQSVLPLVVELATVAMHTDDDTEFAEHVGRRLKEEVKTSEQAQRLISTLAAFAGCAVKAWADDTERDPDEVMQAIGLAVAMEDDDS